MEGRYWSSTASDVVKSISHAEDNAVEVLLTASIVDIQGVRRNIVVEEGRLMRRSSKAVTRQHVLRYTDGRGIGIIETG